MNALFRFPNARRHEPEIDAWLHLVPDPLAGIAQPCFALIRACGEDVRELMHDGRPTACVGDAAFVYVDAFRAHVNVGFFRGAELMDPDTLLLGTGKYLRHVKLTPATAERVMPALATLIRTAYQDMRARLETHGD